MRWQVRWPTGPAGKPSKNVLNPQNEATPLDSKLLLTLRRGDVFSHDLPGGGGYGDPFERDPESVRDDVLNGFVSEAAAREEYGVVTDGRQVDEAATAALRAGRATSASPAVNWE